MTEFRNLPPAESVRRIDFEKAEVHVGIVPGPYLLVVSGQKPYMNMQVELRPLMYVTQPDYWGIEVLGSVHGMFLPAFSPYSVSLLLEGIRGTKGIEVIGATKSQKLDIS